MATEWPHCSEQMDVPPSFDSSNIQWVRMRNKDYYKVFEDDCQESEWHGSDQSDPEDAVVMEYSVSSCAMKDWLGDGEPFQECSSNSWEKVVKYTRHSEERARNWQVSHALVSGHHKNAPLSVIVEAAANCKVYSREVPYAERCAERRGWKKSQKIQKDRDLAISAPDPGKTIGRGKGGKKSGGKGKGASQRSRSPRGQRVVTADSLATSFSQPVEVVLQDTRDRLSKLMEQSEMGRVLAGDIGISFLPAGRVSPEASQREVSIRLVELQFMKDQVARADAQVCDAAKTMLQSITRLSQTSENLKEVNSCLDKLLKALIMASNDEASE